MNQVRVWTAVVTVAALIGVIYAANQSNAGDGKDLAASLKKIATAIKKGDMGEAKKLAASAKGFDEEELMTMFKTTKQGGLGFGTSGSDSIDKKIREVMRDGAKAKEAAAFEDAAYHIAAVGLVADAFTVNVKETAKKKKVDWSKFSVDMTTAGLALAKSAQNKAPAEIKTAVTKVNNACTSCHSVFKQ